MSYIAIVLDEDSQIRLKNHIIGLSIDGWETICHHLTITMGSDMKDYPFSFGEEVKFVISSIGYCHGFDLQIKKRPKGCNLDDELAIAGKAVLPEGKFIKNDTPHVTMAVNREKGGKPFFSNFITSWKSLRYPISLKGVVTLCD